MKFTNEMSVAILPTRKENRKVVQELCSTCGNNAPVMLHLAVLNEWEDAADLQFICPACLRKMADVLDNTANL